MKKILPIIFALVLITATAGAQKTVAILPIDAGSVSEEMDEHFEGVHWLGEDSKVMRAAVNTRLSIMGKGYLGLEEAKLATIENERRGRGDILGNVADAGKLLGVDYVVYGRVEKVECRKNHLGFDGSGEIDELFGNVILDIRVVDVARSRYVSVKKVSQSVFDRRIMSGREFMSGLRAKMAGRLARHIDEYINPVKVIAVDDGYAHLNRGADGHLSVGDRLQVFLPSRIRYDEEAGDVTGGREAMIAELRVTHILPKVTMAQVLSYSMLPEVGSFVRVVE